MASGSIFEGKKNFMMIGHVSRKDSLNARTCESRQSNARAWHASHVYPGERLPLRCHK